MKSMVLSAFASSWLLFAPAMWAHRPAKAMVAVVVALIAMIFSPVSMFWAPARVLVAGAGFILAFSNFVFWDSFGVVFSHLIMGSLFVLAGLASPMEHVAARARVAGEAPATGATMWWSTFSARVAAVRWPFTAGTRRFRRAQDQAGI